MEVSGLAYMPGKARANLFWSHLGGDVWKHINRALALLVDGDPGEGRMLALDHLDPRLVHAVFGELLLDNATVLIVADQANPSGGGPQTRDLREIVCGHTAGMNLQPGGIDLLLGRDQFRHQGKKIYCATSQTDYLCLDSHWASRLTNLGQLSHQAWDVSSGRGTSGRTSPCSIPFAQSPAARPDGVGYPPPTPACRHSPGHGRCCNPCRAVLAW